MIKFKTLIMAAVLALAIVGCDSASTTVTVPSTSADDGFTLIESNIGFSTSSSVANLVPTSETYSFSSAVYAPAELDELEDGTDPVVTFTFSEALRTDEDEAVFSVSSMGTDGVITYTDETTSAFTNVFYNMNSATVITSTDVEVSGDTITFTFGAGTFNVDDKVSVLFGVTSEAGEVYQVFTSFQPKANVTSDVTVTDDFSDYYAYAIDDDRVFVLAPAVEETHETDSKDAESILGVSIPAGIDFGAYINDLSLRATNTDIAGDREYQHLQSMETGASISYIPLTYTIATNAKTYDYYRCNDDNDTKAIITDSSSTSDTYFGSLTSDDEAGTQTVFFYIDNDPIKEGDYIKIVPVNSRGESEEHAATYDLIDTVQPYAYKTAISTASAGVDVEYSKATLAWTELNYSDHKNASDGEGHLAFIDSFDVTDPSDTGAWSAIEAIAISMTGVSGLSVNDANGSTKGGTLAYSEVDALEELTEKFDIDTDEVTIASNSTGNLWVIFDGTTVSIYGGFVCHKDDSTVDYTSDDWQVSGNFNFNITDMSGNALIFNEADSGDSITDGNMTISFL